MKENRNITFFEFCPERYDLVFRKALSRKEFLRFFNFRVRFNDKIEFTVNERKHPLEYICPIIKFKHTPI